mgnify:CR=1 FL=1
MAIVNKGFPGTVNATEYAKSWHLGGADGCDGTGWLTTQGTGRQASTASGDAFASGILSTNSAPILTAIPTPVAGQWFLIVRRINWAGSGTVSVAAVAHTTTTTTVPTSPPGTYPTINTAPGSMYDHKLAWAWARNTDTTMAFFDLRKNPLPTRLDGYDVNIATLLSATATLNAGAGRGTGANFPAANPAALDAISTAVIGDIAQVTLPGTGVDPILFRAVAGSGSGIDWRVDGAIYADTKANLDTATTTLTGITDIIFRVGDQAYAADTAITYRWSGSTWQAWECDWISWNTAPTNLTVGSGGSAAIVQRYKYINGRISFNAKYTLGTSGFSMGTNPTITLPFAVKMLPAANYPLVGGGQIYRSSTNTVPNLASGQIQTSTTVRLNSVAAGVFGTITATAPFTWAAGDIIEVDFWADMP